MIFNLILIIWYVAASLVDFLNTGQLISDFGLIKQAEAMDADTTYTANMQDSMVSEFFFDLDLDGKEETIWVHNSLGTEIGYESTKLFVDNQTTPVAVLSGFFHGINSHSLTPQSKPILVVRTTSGHSFETTFFLFDGEQLKVIPVSTARPPAFYGIVSRNLPEFINVNEDSVLELVVYYRHFPPAKKRTVEVYSFDGEAFIKTQDYEESLPELYL